MAKQKKINVFRFLLIVLLVFFAVQITRQELKIYEINKEIDASKTRIADLKEKQLQLQKERENASNPAYIEKIAREDYNMVKKGEVPVLVKER